MNMSVEEALRFVITAGVLAPGQNSDEIDPGDVPLTPIVIKGIPTDPMATDTQNKTDTNADKDD